MMKRSRKEKKTSDAKGGKDKSRRNISTDANDRDGLALQSAVFIRTILH